MKDADNPPASGLLEGELKVINIGLDLFADELESVGATVVRVDWRPPAGGDPRLATLLGKMAG
jgi:FdrA protein